MLLDESEKFFKSIISVIILAKNEIPFKTELKLLVLKLPTSPNAIKTKVNSILLIDLQF